MFNIFIIIPYFIFHMILILNTVLFLLGFCDIFYRVVLVS